MVERRCQGFPERGLEEILDGAIGTGPKPEIHVHRRRVRRIRSVQDKTKRPRTLEEVARRVAAGEQNFDPALREFLDVYYAVYYANPGEREAAIKQQPRPLDALRGTWLAAVAEHLARADRLEIPYWAETQGLDLQHPFFAGNPQSTKARLMVESPTAFRRRMLFVSKDALFRPRAVRGAR